MGQVRDAAVGDPEPGRPDRPVEVLDQGPSRQAPGPRRLTRSSASRSQLHRFCQLDFPFAPGPAPGRYLVREDEDHADVIVFETVGAELRLGPGRRLTRRRPTRADADDRAAEPVEVTRVTVIPGLPLENADAARAWLSGCGDPDTAAAEVDAALRLVNRAIQAYRVSAGDAYAGDVARTRARRVRLGYGSGDELVEGGWRDAVAVPPEARRGGRRRMLAPQEQLAGILSGRRAVHPSEDLVLRARVDLDEGRTREAALQAQAALAALRAELESEAIPPEAERLTTLATAALKGPLDDAQARSLEEALTQVERVVRRRRHTGD